MLFEFIISIHTLNEIYDCKILLFYAVWEFGEGQDSSKNYHFEYPIFKKRQTYLVSKFTFTKDVIFCDVSIKSIL